MAVRISIVARTDEDADGRSGETCKTPITGSNPVVASNFSSGSSACTQGAFPSHERTNCLMRSIRSGVGSRTNPG